MAQLRLRPHFQDGKPAGFVVGQVQKGSMFDQAGLKEGDVVVAINDEEVKTPNQLLKAYKEVSQDKELWLDVLRDGQEENVEIDLEAAFSKS
jgi:general secretion pathway protein C